MEPERNEVYERIPWETLEKSGGDRQWLVYAVAGAVVLGALAYSFMKSQPSAAPPADTVVAEPAPVTTITSKPDTPLSTVASPVVVAEADLYAVEPERLIDRAAAHAEWLAVEYVAFDGSEESRETLRALLPGDIPLPEAPEATQVFVDWVRARAVTQTGSLSFEVEVLVRSLLSTGDDGFIRQAPISITMPVVIGDDGEAQAGGVPRMAGVEIGAAAQLELVDPPENISDQIDQGDVAGGIQRGDGSWDVVVMAEWPDGVRRATLIRP